MVDAALSFCLLEEWSESLPVWELHSILDYLEARSSILAESLSSSKGKGLVLLRMCNQIIRRLSKSKDAPLCGRVLLFISKAFPSGERSGANLRGDINTENVTPIEGDQGDSPEGFDYPFYVSFWRLQFFMYHPVQALLSDNWGVIRKCLTDLFETFERTKCLRSAVSGGGEPPQGEYHGALSLQLYPKFLSDTRIFSLQLSDPNFRQVIIVQVAIFLQHLLAYSESEKNRPPSTRSLTVSLLSKDQELWITEFNRKILAQASLSLESGKSFYEQLRWILKCERNWMEWKSSSCPPFERDPEESFAILQAHREVFYNETELFDPQNLGSDELNRLWSHSNSKGSSSNSSTFSKPSLREFFEALVEQLDPQSGVEEEYRLSRDEIFRWKSLRLLMNDESALEAFGQCTTAHEIDSFCQRFLPEVSLCPSSEDAPLQDRDEIRTCLTSKDFPDDHIASCSSEHAHDGHAEIDSGSAMDA